MHRFWRVWVGYECGGGKVDHAPPPLPSCSEGRLSPGLYILYWHNLPTAHFIMRFHSILFGCFLALIIVLTLPDISAASPASYFDDGMYYFSFLFVFALFYFELLNYLYAFLFLGLSNFKHLNS